jgi:hypothetical protein
MRRAHPLVQERGAQLRQRLDESDLRTADVGSCMFNPQACALALEEAVVRAAPWIFRILPAVEEGAAAAAVGSEAIMLTPLFIPGDSAQPWQAKDVDLDALADKRAGDLISGSLKGSKSYAGELADKTVGALRELAKGDGAIAGKAGKMLKLIKEGARLRAKNK